LHKIILVDSEWWKIRTNEEIDLLIEYAGVVGYMKAHGMR